MSKSFEIKDLSMLQDFIEHYSFATVISYFDHHFQISHVPLMLDRSLGPYGTLKGHFAKLNPHAEQIENTDNHTICVFHGPHAYISPAWYESYPNVPTWNYAAVHVHGKLKPINQTTLSTVLTKFVTIHEAKLGENTDYIIPENYQDKLIEHIVGFSIEIENFDRKFKLGQNRSAADQIGMLAGLRNEKSLENQMYINFIESINNLNFKDNK